MRDSSPSSYPPAPEAGGILSIDLSALAANWRLLRDRAAGAECAAVVKADAYGIGLEAAVPALAREGCRTFFVAHLLEALRTRAVAPDAAIYVLNGLLPGTEARCFEANLRPVLGSQEEIDEWAAFCRERRTRLPAALHVDTGMNRLGLSMAEGLALQGDVRLDAIGPVLLMSHLVSAEEPENPINRRQIESFEAVRNALPGTHASLANSSGIFLPKRPHYDLVRPGYALYGGNPQPDRENPMRPVITLHARIIQVRTVEPGATVGYNGTWTAPGRRRLATVSAGYADGYARGASRTDLTIDSKRPAGEAIVAGQRCPLVGRVSMDLIVLDVSNVPAGAARRGDPVTLIGEGLDIDEVGRRAGTIGYEILTGLGRRYARTYVSE